jgi:ribonuclease HI
MPTAPSSALESLAPGDVAYLGGICKRNGMPGGVAGIGVWWGKNDPRNLSERCPGKQTNNRANLIALARVLETTPDTKIPLLVKTDLKYTVDCFNSWLPGWRKNGFRTSSKGHVLNSPLIRYIDALLSKRKLAGQEVQLECEPESSESPKSPGITYAKELANKGRMREKVEERPWAELEKEVRDEEEHEAVSGPVAHPAGAVSAVTPTNPAARFAATGDLCRKPGQTEVVKAEERHSNSVAEVVASIEDIDLQHVPKHARITGNKGAKEPANKGACAKR